MPHKKQIPQTKQIRMWPVTFNILYLILYKCPELVPDLQNIFSAKRDLNEPYSPIPSKLKLKCKEGKCLVYEGAYSIAVSGTRVLTMNSWFFMLRTWPRGMYRFWSAPDHSLAPVIWVPSCFGYQFKMNWAYFLISRNVYTKFSLPKGNYLSKLGYCLWKYLDS